MKNDPNATQDARKVLQEARIFASERKLVPVVVGGAPAIGVPVICEEEHLVSRLVIWHFKLIFAGGPRYEVRCMILKARRKS